MSAGDVGYRIAIIGPHGTGKSTLARAIGSTCALPVIHLDRLFWQPGWQPLQPAEFQRCVGDAVAGPGWVMDGTYASTLPMRLPRTTHVIWLDLPRRVYFPRTVWRLVWNHGRQRPDVGEGCPERFDRTFLFGWVWGYPGHNRRRDRMLFEALPPAIRGIRLATRRDVRQFIAAWPLTPTDKN